MIQSGRQSRENLATAYYNRDTAWDDKVDYDRAIADLNEATRLNPKYFAAYINRSQAS